MELQTGFLNYFQDKINIQTDDLADFLFIDIRTLYNYKSMSIDQLPNKVKEKLIIFFQGHAAFYREGLTLNDIYRLLDEVDQKTRDYVRTKFLETAAIRKKNYVVTNTQELIKKTSTKRNVNSLDDFLEDFRILVEYSNLSKGYLYTIFEIIISKVDAENDYQFLDYINRYKKEEKK